jgi:hypothetical protein
MRQTEFAQSFKTESGVESNVEIGARIVPKRQEDLNSGLIVTHPQGNREGARGNRHLSPVGGLGHATTGEGRHCVLIEAATRGILEVKVSGDNWREGKQVRRRELHCSSDVDSSGYEDDEVIVEILGKRG